MFRLWGKIYKDNKLLKDTVVCDDSNDTRTHKVFHALEQICYEEFKTHAKARFHQDNFVEQIEFDFLEIHVIEE